MKAFKDSDIQLEEEMIEKSIHDSNFQPLISEFNLVKNEESKPLLNNNDIIIDVQGDEPLIHPLDIDKIIKFFIKNKFEVVVPHIKFYSKNKTNIVKLL